MKIAFLDRDGTINKDYPDKVWANVTEPELLPGSISGMKKIMELGYKIIIITNQYIINEGIITESQYSEFHSKLLEKLYLEGIVVYDTFYCPHTSSEQCNCMKPKTGLIEKALLKYSSINLSQSFLVGDSLCDALLAEELKLRYFIVGNKEMNLSFQNCRVNTLFDVGVLLEKETI